MNERLARLMWLALVLCLGAVFFLSGMEAGVFALSRMRVRQQMRAGRRFGEGAARLSRESGKLSLDDLVGNTVANFSFLAGLVFI